MAAAVLMALGLKSLLAPVDLRRPSVNRASTSELSTAGFAEMFARAYLTWDADGSERRDETVARFMPTADIGAADDTGRRDQQVLWTVVVGERPAGDRRRIVTVAAHTSVSLVHLAVTVTRDARGFLAVPTAPAIVGPPATSASIDEESERDVEDARLRNVSRRVVTNFLAREREDLAADLHPRAVVSVPTEPLEVSAIEGVTWVAPERRVAVTLTAAGAHGVRLALRYELTVSREAGRWLVRTVHVNPTARESSG
jgi:hypothetical protein